MDTNAPAPKPDMIEHAGKLLKRLNGMSYVSDHLVANNENSAAVTTPNVEIPIQWRDVPPHENPYDNPDWQSGQCDLCAISGLPYDDCDQLHEGNCEWQCGLCGGNWATCRCPDDPAVTAMVAATARPSVSWAAAVIDTYLKNKGIHAVGEQIAAIRSSYAMSWQINLIQSGVGHELTLTDIAGGIDLLLSRLLDKAQAEYDARGGSA